MLPKPSFAQYASRIAVVRQNQNQNQQQEQQNQQVQKERINVPQHPGMIGVTPVDLNTGETEAVYRSKLAAAQQQFNANIQRLQREDPRGYAAKVNQYQTLLNEIVESFKKKRANDVYTSYEDYNSKHPVHKHPGSTNLEYVAELHRRRFIPLMRISNNLNFTESVMFNNP